MRLQSEFRSWPLVASVQAFQVLSHWQRAQSLEGNEGMFHHVSVGAPRRAKQAVADLSIMPPG